jgi:hypothetical protein
MSNTVLRVKVLPSNSGSRWVGYYGHKRRTPGEVFDLNEASDFSSRWMEPIGWTPEGYTPKTAPKTAVLKAPPPPRTPLKKDPNQTPPPAMPTTRAQVPPAEPAAAPVVEDANAGAAEKEETPI